MECLDYGNTAFVSGVMNCRRNHWKEVVNVDYVRLKAKEPLSEGALRLSGPQASDGCLQTLKRPFDCVVIGFENFHLMQMLSKQIRFSFYNVVFPARLLVSIVN